MNSESIPSSDRDFWAIAETLKFLDADQATRLKEAAESSSDTPEQVALKKGLLNSIQFDIVQTLLKPNDVIPGYELLDVLGYGGMGVVYRARQKNLDRVVALKTILISQMGNSSSVSRFELEARTVAKLRHPNIVSAIDFGRHEGRLFFVMEYVEGEDAERLISRHAKIGRQGRQDEELAWGIARQAAAGLAHAAKASVVHRDIKPANLLLVEPPEGFELPAGIPMVKITDFGLAFLTRESEADTRITAHNTTVGSPHYMSPEQLRGEEVDYRADIYSVGATVYNIISGRAPFAGGNITQVLTQKLSTDVPPLHQILSEVSIETSKLVERMMERDPIKRIPDYETLIDEIDVILGIKDEGSTIIPAIEGTASGFESSSLSKKTTTIEVVKIPTAETVETQLELPSQVHAASDQQPQSNKLRRSIAVIGAGALLLVIAIVIAAMGLSKPSFQVYEGVSAANFVVQPSSVQSLFDGKPLDIINTWKLVNGSWTNGRNDEDADVLVGLSLQRLGLVRRLLPTDDTLPENYRVQAVIQLHAASMTEIRFGRIIADDDGARAPFAVQFGNSEISVIERTLGADNQVAILPLANFRPDRLYLVELNRFEAQPGKFLWTVSIDGNQIVAFDAISTAAVSPTEIQLGVLGGEAYFSDLQFYQLMPSMAATTD